MKKLHILFFICTLFYQTTYASETPVDYANPLVGTLSKFSLSNGNTYPAIARPWGMNFWTPQTGKMGDGWTYRYDADKIRGFKQTHQPSPWINDYGQFSIFPITGAPTFDQDERASWFSHKAEEATPYSYKVYLADHDILTELTPTERAAIFKFTFPRNDHSYVVVDAFDDGSYIKVIPEENKIIGYTTKNSGGVPENFKNYFVITFDKKFAYTATVDEKVLKENRLETTSKHAYGIIGFSTNKGEVVHAKVASSFISFEQAELNLKELGNKSFEELKAEGKDRWNKVLGRIEVVDKNIDKLRTFYSCFYRSVLFPRSFYEIDRNGKVVHYSPYNGKVVPGYMFTDTGFWDTFRCLFPFLNLAFPSMNAKIQEGLANTYKESGFLPEWASPGHRGCMVGNNSASVVADAYIKGIRGQDVEALWEAVVHGANATHPKVSSTGRLGYEYYNELGYVPYDVKINENAARTLEYAYDDWCIYKFGQALGKPKSEIGIYAKRALNYKNLYDKEHKLMRGRNKNGEFQSPFNPLKWGDAFTEGNSWHYSWSVFHDPKGLINLMGGKREFNKMMDSVFSVPPLFDDSYYGGIIHEIREMQIMNMGNYAHGNQPIQHMIYLYNYSGEPWKAQYWIREVVDKLYTAAPDGYCGDEDNGQTSAWYVFSAMGFYPVCPGSNEYIIGSPIFDKVSVHLENNKTLLLKSYNNSKNNRYINSITVDGKEYDKNYFTHELLNSGATIEYKMSDKPNTSRGTKDSSFPYSFTDELESKK
ncbi:MAG: GH92 family glycosyl hydrolase [Bacteroidales bacterium]